MNKIKFKADMKPIFDEVIKENGWEIGSATNTKSPRFLTKNLMNKIPDDSDSLANKLFYFNIEENRRGDKLVFKTIVLPLPPKNDYLKIKREDIIKKIAKIAGAKEPRGVKYVVHFIVSFDFNAEGMRQKTKDQIKADIQNKIISEIKPIVEKVENSLLQ